MPARALDCQGGRQGTLVSMADAMEPTLLVDVEQNFHNLEQRYVRLREENTRVLSERDALRDANATLDTSASAARRQLQEATTALGTSEAAALARSRELARVSAERDALQEKSDRSASETDRLRDELREREAAADEARRALATTRTALGEAEAARTPLLLEAERMRKEKAAVDE